MNTATEHRPANGLDGKNSKSVNMTWTAETRGQRDGTEALAAKRQQ